MNDPASAERHLRADMCVRPRVALVRGRYLNAWEAQSYAPLTDAFEITGFASHDPDFDLTHLPFPWLGLFAPEQRALGGGIPSRIVRRTLARRVASDMLRGLTERLVGFDVVHSAETHLAFSAQAADACRRFRTPFVLTCWENLPFSYYDDPVVRARKQSVRSAVDLFLATTPSAASALRSEGVDSSRIRVVLPGVDLERFSPQPSDASVRSWRSDLGIPDEALMVLYVGRLIREKGLVYLLMAMAQIPSTICGRPVHLVLAGEGPWRAALETIAQELAVEKHVVFAGSVERELLPDLYRSADLFILPSVPAPYWQEQFGMVLAEAMACGLPVVATESGSIPEVVGLAAHLVRPYDAGALAVGIERVLAEPDLRAELGAIARGHAEMHLDARRAAGQIGDAYRTVLGITARDDGAEIEHNAS